MKSSDGKSNGGRERIRVATAQGSSGLSDVVQLRPGTRGDRVPSGTPTVARDIARGVEQGEQGDLLARLPAMSARVLRFSEEISQGEPDRADYLHGVLCQVGLPRSATRSTRFERTNGSASLLIEAGNLWNGKTWIEQPLPYGTRPRLALVFVSSEAVRTNSPVVEVGRSMRHFLQRINIGDGGRQFESFRRQMNALAACRMTIGFGTSTVDAKPIKRFTAWADGSNDPSHLSPGVIELSPEFFASLKASAVPLDPRALSALQNSALALDVYTWLAHRLVRVRARGEKLSWANLRSQFGQEYADPKNFKRELLRVLGTVQEAYPMADFRRVSTGLVLRPSPPPVAHLPEGGKGTCRP